MSRIAIRAAATLHGLAISIEAGAARARVVALAAVVGFAAGIDALQAAAGEAVRAAACTADAGARFVDAVALGVVVTALTAC